MQQVTVAPFFKRENTRKDVTSPTPCRRFSESSPQVVHHVRGHSPARTQACDIHAGPGHGRDLRLLLLLGFFNWDGKFNFKIMVNAIQERRVQPDSSAYWKMNGGVLPRGAAKLPHSTTIEGVRVLPGRHTPSGGQLARGRAEHWSALVLPVMPRMVFGIYQIRAGCFFLYAQMLYAFSIPLYVQI